MCIYIYKTKNYIITLLIVSRLSPRKYIESIFLKGCTYQNRIINGI